MKLRILSIALMLLTITTQAQSIREIGDYKMLYISVEDAPQGVELELSDVSMSSCGKTPGAIAKEKSVSEDLSIISLVGMMITMDCPVRILPGGGFEAFPRLSYLRRASIKLLNNSNSDRFTKTILVPSSVTYSVKAL